ncbi:nitroreductase family protein [Allokutzneria sp. A3M-2-11 16]|uniref:nitroreductase family protein n=1 Tax=Allokutzneria sp. A3M-2-11 16 TaxID=2962043 RepID=UPI0020B6FACA|nr:nitroreductase family protein [Allokutzneria sp. A3M-2-11 16]MCP3803917.1 nitroreductase family protein [Allokutzneria sp. A3M-2-11 16]
MGENMTYQRLSADEVLTTTRSVRRRLDLERPVDLALVRESLEIALQAPSGSNAQRWHFVVITDAEKRAAIGKIYQRACHQYLDGPGAAGKLHAEDAERSKVQQRVHDSVAYLADVMGQVPVQVIACARTGSASLSPGNQSALWGSVLPAAWSYMLAARERGLGTAWTTLHLTYEREVADVLGIPEDVHQGVLLPTAHYTGTTFKPAPRQPLDEVLHVNQW